MKKLLATIAIVGLAASFANAQVELGLEGSDFVLSNNGSEAVGLLGLNVSSADGGLVAPENGGPLFAFTLPSTANLVSVGNLGTAYELGGGASKVVTGVQYTGSTDDKGDWSNFAGSSTGGASGVSDVAFPTLPPNNTPEPAGGLLAAFAVMGLLGFRRRR